MFTVPTLFSILSDVCLHPDVHTEPGKQMLKFFLAHLLGSTDSVSFGGLSSGCTVFDDSRRLPKVYLKQDKTNKFKQKIKGMRRPSVSPPSD